MSLALAAERPKLRLAGRSFLAFVLEPQEPIGDWLADLDDVARQSFGFFANRPVVLNLSALAPDRTATEALLAALRARSIRVIAVEGIDPAFAPGLAPLATGKDSAKIIEFPRAGEPLRPAPVPAAAAGLAPIEAPVPPPTPLPVTASAPPPVSATSLIIDKPVRSGQTIFHPEGDLIVLGSVASGAEVIAGGSIHVYGRLRGRAIAGAMGNDEARIFCRKFEAELVAIDGCYRAAEQCAPEHHGKPVRIHLSGDALVTEILD